MPSLPFFTPGEQTAFKDINKQYRYNHSVVQVTLRDDVVTLPQNYVQTTVRRCPDAFYEILNEKPPQQPCEYLIEVDAGTGIGLRFFDLTAAVVHGKESDYSSVLARVAEDGTLTLPIELIVKAGFRKTEPKGKLTIGPFEGYDTFGLWTPKAYAERISSSKKT